MHRQRGTVLPTFTIHIQNKRNGIVVANNHIADLCSGVPMRPEDLNQVTVYATLGEEELICDSNVVTLVDREARVTCSLASGLDASRGEYETPIHVKLTYGYSDTISKKFTIVK
jgi:hypothetical protein